MRGEQCDTLNSKIINTIIYSKIMFDSQQKMSNKNFLNNIRILPQNLGYHND